MIDVDLALSHLRLPPTSLDLKECFRAPFRKVHESNHDLGHLGGFDQSSRSKNLTFSADSMLRPGSPPASDINAVFKEYAIKRTLASDDPNSSSGNPVLDSCSSVPSVVSHTSEFKKILALPREQPGAKEDSVSQASKGTQVKFVASDNGNASEVIKISQDGLKDQPARRNTFTPGSSAPRKRPQRARTGTPIIPALQQKPGGFSWSSQFRILDTPLKVLTEKPICQARPSANTPLVLGWGKLPAVDTIRVRRSYATPLLRNGGRRSKTDTPVVASLQQAPGGTRGIHAKISATPSKEISQYLRAEWANPEDSDNAFEGPSSTFEALDLTLNSDALTLLPAEKAGDDPDGSKHSNPFDANSDMYHSDPGSRPGGRNERNGITSSLSSPPNELSSSLLVMRRRKVKRDADGTAKTPGTSSRPERVKETKGNCPRMEDDPSGDVRQAKPYPAGDVLDSFMASSADNQGQDQSAPNADMPGQMLAPLTPSTLEGEETSHRGISGKRNAIKITTSTPAGGSALPTPPATAIASKQDARGRELLSANVLALTSGPDKS